MSNPRIDYDAPAYGVGIELISAMSALNMETTPIEDVPEDAFYLSETDAMAKHAYEHMHAAYKLAQKTEKLVNGFYRAIEWHLHLVHANACLSWQ